MNRVVINRMHPEVHSFDYDKRLGMNPQGNIPVGGQIKVHCGNSLREFTTSQVIHSDDGRSSRVAGVPYFNG
jgi:hypothetical protein